MFETNKAIWKVGDKVRFRREYDSDMGEWLDIIPEEGVFSITRFDDESRAFIVFLESEEGYTSAAHPLELEEADV